MRKLALTLIALTTAAHADNTLLVGDGQIDGSKLQPYELTWRQCSLQDGKWLAGNDLTERLVAIGDGVLRIQQRVQRKDGSMVRSSSYFDRHSFAPLRLEQRIVAADGAELGGAAHSLDDQGYSGHRSRGGETKEVAGAATNAMLHGGAMGLPLATLEYQHEPLVFAASMIGFDATYEVIATWAGKESFEFKGKNVEAWMIDIEWHHVELGDVYPPGPDASGGRYWVVHNPPSGFPYVPRYKTDAYAVEFVAGNCPINR